MKTVQNHTGYAEAADLLQRLQDKHAELTQEQQALLAQLRFKEPQTVDAPSLRDRALALVDGQPLPPGRAGLVDQVRDKELEIRQQLEILNQALLRQPQTVEIERQRARGAALDARAKDLDKISKAWAAAEDALRAALATEDALTNDLLDGGFGLHPPSHRGWLNRDFAKSELMS